MSSLTDLPRVLVLAGGISHERDVSLRSGARVAEALRQLGVEVYQAEPDSTLLGTLDDLAPDVIWPALHGASGEDGALRDLLSRGGIPYVGARGSATRLAWEKPVAKGIVASHGLATTVSVTLPRETFRELDARSVITYLGKHLSLPLVVKPARGGSAMGVSMVDDLSQLPRALVDAYTYCDVALIEQRVYGTEIAISLIDEGDGVVALPAVEIIPLSGVYSFEARYNAGETDFFCPARLSETHLAQAVEAATTAHQVLGLRHLSRVDLIVDADGTPWFLEANVLPGLTETSLFPLALQASGRSPGETYLRLAQAAARDR